MDMLFHVPMLGGIPLINMYGFTSCRVWMSFVKSLHKGLANAQIFLPFTQAVQLTFR